MSLPDPPSFMARLARLPHLASCSLLIVACATGGGTTAPPPAVASTGPGVTTPPGASTQPAATASTPGDAVVPDVPTACYDLGEQDCRRVATQVASGIPAGSPPVGYIQVGPFGCPTEQPCPTTLAARPEGDVVLEFPGGASAFHVKVDDDRLEVQPQEAVGVLLAPTTRPPLPAAAQPFTLGHCGLWSGVDLGGSWWDPVGFVDSGHPDAINAAAGTLVLVGPDRALFTSNGGLIVQLVRRDGEKFLPLCR